MTIQINNDATITKTMPVKTFDGNGNQIGTMNSSITYTPLDYNSWQAAMQDADVKPYAQLAWSGLQEPAVPASN